MIGTRALKRLEPGRAAAALAIGLGMLVGISSAMAGSAVALAPGATHTLPIPIDAGQATTLTLHQRSSGAIRMRWSPATGAAPVSLATEAGRDAVLAITLVADAARTMRVEISVVDGSAPADFAVDVATVHAATAADRANAEADLALAHAEAIRAAGDKSGADRAEKLYAAAATAAGRGGDACRVRRVVLAQAGFEHERANAAGQAAAAKAALASPCAGDPAGEALAERLLGSAYINQGDFAAGVRETERAVALFDRTGDSGQRAIALRNLGLAYAESGEIGKALATTQSALAAAETVHDAHLLALLRNDLAFAYNARGEFAHAIEAYRAALAATRDAPFPMAEAVAWINLGVAYGQLGDDRQALDAYEKGRAAAVAIDCWSCLAEIDVDRGDDLFDGGRVADAEASYRRALALARDHQLVRQRAEAMRGLGRTAMAAARWSEARSLLESARAELGRTHGRVNESVVTAMLGDLESRVGNAEAARRDYREALALARAADNEAWQAAALASLARIDRDRARLAAARDEIARAIALIESERTRIEAPDLRTAYFATKRSYYELYIDVLMRLDRAEPDRGHATEALVVAERARARALQDQLAERSVPLDRDVDRQLLDAERAAEDRLHALAWRESGLDAGDTGARAALETGIDAASRALDQARGRIRAASPRYADITHPVPLDGVEIRDRLLDADVGALEYWLGDAASYLWVATRGGIEGFALPPRATIERASAALRAALLAPSRSSADMPFAERAAADAANLDAVRVRAAALADAIVPETARRRLKHAVAIVADGALESIPFSVLLDGDSAPPQALVYLPSLGTLRGLRALPTSSAPPRAVAVIADPVFRADDRRLGGRGKAREEAPDAVLLRAASAAGVGDLARLPSTRAEAQAIAALSDPDASWIALDFAANRAAVLDATWSRYAIVHFATHALVNARHPELSGVVLSLFDANGRPEDGFLRVNDIYALDMPADLVVLSVCDSAVGRSVGAEGPATLARAFFYAGARRVVASLWPVDDRASVAFMQAFYRALLDGHASPGDALLVARRAMQADPRWRSPYYWAGTVLEGDWR